MGVGIEKGRRVRQRQSPEIYIRALNEDQDTCNPCGVYYTLGIRTIWSGIQVSKCYRDGDLATRHSQRHTGVCILEVHQIGTRKV